MGSLLAGHSDKLAPVIRAGEDSFPMEVQVLDSQCPQCPLMRPWLSVLTPGGKVGNQLMLISGLCNQQNILPPKSNYPTADPGLEYMGFVQNKVIGQTNYWRPIKLELHFSEHSFKNHV